VRRFLGVLALLAALAGCSDGPAAAPAFTGSGLAVCPRPTGPVPAGSALAGIELRCMDGSGHRFAPGAPLGRPVVLTLWGSWCEPCWKELPAFVRLAGARPDRLLVLGVNTEDTESGSVDAVHELGISFANGYDRDAEVQKAVRTPGLPTTVFLDASGTVVHVNKSPLDDASLRAAVRKYLGVPV
jgi:thiol-disulfide isomerase/thioredoxin